MKILISFLVFLFTFSMGYSQDFRVTQMSGYSVEEPKFVINSGNVYLTFATNMKLYKFPVAGPNSPIAQPINPDPYQWGPFQVDIAAHDQKIFIAYTDFKSNLYVIKLAYSLNNGTDWNQIIVDTINFGFSLPTRYDLPRILIGDDGAAYLFYFVFQNDSDTSGIYMYRFYDGMKKKIDTFFQRARYEYAITPFVKTINNIDNVFLSYWIDSSFYLIRSTNGGSNFSSPNLIQKIDVLWPFFDWQSTFLTDELGMLYFKYDYQEFQIPFGWSRKFFVTKSSNYGQNWSEPVLIDTSFKYVDLRLVGNQFVKYFVNEDWNLYMSQSSDLINWSELVRVNMFDSSVVSNYPMARVFGNKLAFAWIDSRTGYSEIFYRLMDIQTSITEKISPVDFRLNQNYPNPFNATTEISFILSKKAQTTLKIYDIFGKVIKVLLDDKLNPGEYKINFEGNNLSSGVYFYELISDGSRLVKKMVLIK